MAVIAELEKHWRQCRQNGNCEKCFTYGTYLVKRQVRVSSRRWATGWVIAGYIFLGWVAWLVLENCN